MIGWQTCNGKSALAVRPPTCTTPHSSLMGRYGINFPDILPALSWAISDAKQSIWLHRIQRCSALQSSFKLTGELILVSLCCALWKNRSIHTITRLSRVKLDILMLVTKVGIEPSTYSSEGNGASMIVGFFCRLSCGPRNHCGPCHIL